MPERISNRLRCTGAKEDLEQLREKLLADETVLSEHSLSSLQDEGRVVFDADPLRSGDFLIADYDSAWGPPDDEVLEELSRAFPTICFDNLYAVRWNCAAGRFAVRDGAWLRNEHFSADITADAPLRSAWSTQEERNGIGDPQAAETWRTIGLYLWGLGWYEQATQWLKQSTKPR